MHQFTVERIVNVPHARAWEVAAAFADIYLYNPSVPKSYTINAQTTGLGAERRCELNSSGTQWVEERISAWDAGKTTYTVDIVRGTTPLPVNNAGATISVQPLDANRSKVSMAFSYRPKFGPVGALMNPVMIKPMMKKLVNGIVDGMKHYLETGQEVGSMAVLRAGA